MGKTGNSSWVLFLRNIKGKKLSGSEIRRRFLKEVDKEDYDSSITSELINYAQNHGSTKPHKK